MGGESLEEKIAETMKHLLGEPRICGWVNCTNHFNGDPPREWITLTISKSTTQREVALCPKHRAELEACLKGVAD